MDDDFLWVYVTGPIFIADEELGASVLAAYVISPTHIDGSDGNGQAPGEEELNDGRLKAEKKKPIPCVEVKMPRLEAEERLKVGVYWKWDYIYNKYTTHASTSAKYFFDYTKKVEAAIKNGDYKELDGYKRNWGFKWSSDSWVPHQSFLPDPDCSAEVTGGQKKTRVLPKNHPKHYLVSTLSMVLFLVGYLTKSKFPNQYDRTYDTPVPPTNDGRNNTGGKKNNNGMRNTETQWGEVLKKSSRVLAYLIDSMCGHLLVPNRYESEFAKLLISGGEKTNNYSSIVAEMGMTHGTSTPYGSIPALQAWAELCDAGYLTKFVSGASIGEWMKFLLVAFPHSPYTGEFLTAMGSAMKDRVTHLAWDSFREPSLPEFVHTSPPPGFTGRITNEKTKRTSRPDVSVVGLQNASIIANEVFHQVIFCFFR